LDLFIGDEGILGVVVQAKTRLLPRRKPYFGLLLYLPTRQLTVRLVRLLDALKRHFHDADTAAEQDIMSLMDGVEATRVERFRGIVPSCMEWFGSSVSCFVSTGLSRKLERYYGALYVEQEYEESRGPEEVAATWSDLIELVSQDAEAEEVGVEIEAALNEAQVRRLRDERRTIPEKLAEAIPDGQVKLGLDFAVPMRCLEKLLELYDTCLPKGKSYVFGHIGNAHLHASLLPRTPAEIEECRAIRDRLAQEVCSLGGSISGEHGIGKLKHDDLVLMLGREGIEEICRIKGIMDPRGILNRGNMVKAECCNDCQNE